MIDVIYDDNSQEKVPREFKEKFTAARLGTLPRFVRFETDGDDLRATDVLREIKESRSFKEVRENKRLEGFDRGDLLKLYAAFSVSLNNLPEEYKKETLEAELLRGNLRDVDPDELLASSLKDAIGREILKNIEDVERIRSDTAVIKSSVRTFDVMEDVSSIVRFKVNWRRVSKNTLMELFDRSRLSDKVPFAACQGFFKVHVNSEAQKRWGDVRHEVLNLKIKVSGEITTAIFSVVDAASLILELKLQKDDAATILETIRCCLGFDDEWLDADTREDTHLRKLGYVNNFSFNSYVLADMFMNDQFLDVAYVNELTLKVPCRSVYFKLSPTSSAYCSVSRNGDKFRTRVSLTAKNEADIETLKTFVLNAFAFYEVNKDKVRNAYRAYGVLIGADDVRANEDIGTLERTTFPKGYGALCNNKPREVARDEVDRYKDFLEFPRNSGKYYVCDSVDYPHIGLKTNTLSNRGAFKSLPCCYKNPQQDSDTYREFMGESINYTIPTDYLITSDLPAQNLQYGNLGASITDFLNSIEPDVEFKRIGVIDKRNRREDSFLNCVIVGLQLNTTAARIREILTDDKFLALARQSNYECTTADIRQMLESEYLEPRRFAQVVERLFTCRVVIFNREAADEEGKMTLPYYSKAWFRQQDFEFESVVIIYEHIYANKDMCCELIVQHLDGDEFIHSWDANDNFSTALIDAENELHRTFLGNRVVKTMCLPIALPVTSQFIDNYGKTRIVYFNQITMWTEPVCPMYAVSVELDAIMSSLRYPSENEAQEFLQRMGANGIRSRRTHVEARLNGVKVWVFVSAPLSLGTDTFKRNERLARYLVQATFKFKDFEIVDRAKYDMPQNAVFDRMTTLVRDDRVVVDSEDVKQKLEYVYDLTQSQRPQYIDQLAASDECDEFYKNASDFQAHPNVAVYTSRSGYDNFVDTAAETYLNYKVYDRLLPRERPFIFQSDYITPSHPWLLKKVKSVEEALSWLGETNSAATFTLVAYDDERTKMYEVRGEPTETRAHIMFTIKKHYYAMKEVVNNK